MKKILFLLFATFSLAYAQVPQAFNYQGIARDITGNPLANKPIKIRLSVLAESGGIQTAIYTETHSVTTSQFGLFVLAVGKGSVVSGVFSTIGWTDGTKKLLKTEIDPDGNGYSLNGVSELQSVPYALSAKTVESENQKLTLAGNLLTISQGNSVDLSSLSSGSGSSQWQNNSVGINYNAGKVGIGTNSPLTPLYVEGYFTGIDRTQIAVKNTSTDQDAVAGIGLGVGPTYSGGIQVFSDTYFPSTLPFWNGRMHLGSNSKNGILLNATGNLPSTKIEFAVGTPVNQETPVRMVVGFDGNVGIGTKTPTQKLDINGSLRIQNLNLDNTASKILIADASGVLGYRDVNTFSGTSQWTNFSSGINYNQGKVVIGDATSPHTSSLIISKVATGADRTSMVTQNTSNEIDANNGNYFFAGTGANMAGLDITVNAKSYFPNLGNAGYGIIRSEKMAITAFSNDAVTESFIAFVTGADVNNVNGGVERMRLNKAGFFGIGTTTPKTQLHVNGSVYLEDAAQGMIMRSPNGQCWKVTVGNTGVLTSTSVVCP